MLAALDAIPHHRLTQRPLFVGEDGTPYRQGAHSNSNISSYSGAALSHSHVTPQPGPVHAIAPGAKDPRARDAALFCGRPSSSPERRWGALPSRRGESVR